MSSEASGRDRSDAVREAIRSAAAELFARNGYSATGIRDIASQAGVNSALIIRHFGSKESLFLQTMRVGGEFSVVIRGSVADLGERMVAFLVGPDADLSIRGIYSALLRASDRPEIQEQLRDSLRATVIEPIAAQLEGPDAVLRAQLFAAVMSGVMNALWISADPGLRDEGSETLIRRFGAVLQNTLAAD